MIQLISKGAERSETRGKRDAECHRLGEQNALRSEFRDPLVKLSECSIQRTSWKLLASQARARQNANLFCESAVNFFELVPQLVNDGTGQGVFGEIKSGVKDADKRYQIGVVGG